MTTRKSSPFVATLLAVGALLTISACGGDGASAGTAPAGVDVEVRAIDGIAWNAASYTATATDGSITLFGANDSSLPHNIFVVDADGNDVGTSIDLPTRGSSGTLDVQLAPGEYRIVCRIPGHTNMDSALTVD